MELKVSKLGLVGLILSAIGMALFTSLDTSLNLNNIFTFQVQPAIGAVILGIGLAFIFHEKNTLATILTSISFLVMSVLNIFTIGFSLGVLVPGLTGKFKSLPTYLAVLLVFLAGVYSASIHPYHYKSMFLDQIADLAISNMDAYKSSLESRVESLIPDKQRSRELAAAMVPCVNETYKEQCEAIREQVANQIYQQTHTKEYKEALLEKLGSISLDKETLKNSIRDMPIIESLLRNFPLVVGGLEAVIFLIYSGVFLGIPQSITSSILGLLVKNKKSEDTSESAKEDQETQNQ